jgi:hypothetical protein
MIRCDNCGHINPSSENHCESCGEPLDSLGTTQSLPALPVDESDPRWGTARFGAAMNLVLTPVEYANYPLVVDAENVNEIVVGRSDPNTGHMPDIDLRPYNAVERGVSRRHAIIARRNGALNVIDLGTPNGTFLNGQRLVPNQARVLRDGDDLRLGHLIIHVAFERQ